MIHKIKLPVRSTHFGVKLSAPEYKCLSLQLQRGEPVMWVEYPEITENTYVHNFIWITTGSCAPEGSEYIGTIQLHDGALVLHLYKLP